MLKAIVVALLLTCGTAFSQEPSPSGGVAAQPEQPKAAEPQTPATTNQQPAAQTPVVVNIAAPQKSEAEKEDERHEREEKANLDRRLVELTGDLAFFTAALFYATGALVFATVIMAFFAFFQSRDMKASIALARDEFLSSHRPKIRVKHVVLTKGLGDGEQLSADIIFVNRGATDAQVEEWGIRFFVEQKGLMLPPITSFEWVRQAAFVGHVTIPGRSLRINGVSDGTQLTEDNFVAIINDESRLYCAGYMHYRDNAGRIRTTAFCQVLEFPAYPDAAQETGRFRPFVDPDYAYED